MLCGVAEKTTVFGPDTRRGFLQLKIQAEVLGKYQVCCFDVEFIFSVDCLLVFPFWILSFLSWRYWRFPVFVGTGS
jgi:hypothetical protein